MALPWLRIIDTALNVTDMVRRNRAARRNEPSRLTPGPLAALGGIEARLAGVVVAALKEAFDRDNRRLELEREQLEAERQRAERALRLELIRQAGEREIGRQRIVAGAAVVGWVGALVFALRSPLALGGRVTLAAGLALLIVGLACAVVEQAHQARSISAGDERLSVETLTAVGAAGLSSPWLVVAGYAAIAAAATFG